MSERPLQELDKLFQQEPKQYPFAYNEASWNKMEELLDKGDQRRLLWWRFVGIGVLLLVGLIFFFEQRETKVVKISLGFDKKEIVESQSRESKFKNQIFKSEEFGGNDQLNSNVIKNKNELGTSNLTSIKNVEQYNYKKQKEDLTLAFDDFEFRKNEKSNRIIFDSILQETDTLSEGLLLDKLEVEKKEQDSVSTLSQVDSILPVVSLNLSILKEKEILGILFKREKVLGVPVENKNILLLGLVVGGESTGINRDDFSQPNLRIGGQIEYRFLEKFSVSLGTSFIRKKYGAKGSDYQPEDGLWLYDVAPTLVDASCDILELPISIGLFQKGNNQNGFYSKFGITSIIMLEENYWYFYDQEIPGQIKYWGVENENKHWFGIGEVALGYQKYLTPKTFIQIEPFLQIPLAGIGNGNVKLWSLGVNMKFNFQVNKRLLGSQLKK